MQHEEEHRRNRQGTYHRIMMGLERWSDLLSDRGWQLAAMGDPDSATQQRWANEFGVEQQAVRSEIMGLLAGVLIFGPPPVRQAAAALREQFSEVDRESLLAVLEGTEGSTADRFWNGLLSSLTSDKSLSGLREKVDDLRVAMADDVAPVGVIEPPLHPAQGPF